MIQEEQILMVPRVGENVTKVDLMFIAGGLAIAGELEIWTQEMLGRFRTLWSEDS